MPGWLNLPGILIGAFLYISYVVLFKKSSSLRQIEQDHIDIRIGNLPRGMTSKVACDKLQSKYRISDATSLHNAGRSVVYHWNSLKCSKLLASYDTKDKQSSSAMTLSEEEASAASKPSSHSSSPSTQCRELKDGYQVIPRSSWGSLPLNLQSVWIRLDCDHLLERSIAGTIHETTEGKKNKVRKGFPLGEDTMLPKTLHEQHTTSSSSQGKERASAAFALPVLSEKNSDWCSFSKSKYSVIPMKSWGSLPMNMQEEWKSRGCDIVFTTARMGRRSVSFCFGNESTPFPSPLLKSLLSSHLSSAVSPADAIAAAWSATISTAGSASKSSSSSFSGSPKSSDMLPLSLSRYFSTLPLISIMAATTTRKIRNPSPDNLALFTFMLPSLIRSLDCGFRYEYVLGFDMGDPFYDSEEGMFKVKKWFRDKVAKPMLKNRILLTLRVVKVNNSLKKPGPVFLEMARAAFEGGASYLYRINDDTELMDNWPAAFVGALHALSEPYGVVGPTCNQGNQKILTHDFVSRVHMDVFEMNYYPAQLTDWWMDDWISLVYGKRRTFKAQGVQVMHHTGAHGQRYEVDHGNENMLANLVESGRKQIRNWMLKHSVSTAVLKDFDSDLYRRDAFAHTDVPGTVVDNAHVKDIAGRDTNKNKNRVGSVDGDIAAGVGTLRVKKRSRRERIRPKDRTQKTRAGGEVLDADIMDATRSGAGGGGDSSVWGDGSDVDVDALILKTEAEAGEGSRSNREKDGGVNVGAGGAEGGVDTAGRRGNKRGKRFGRGELDQDQAGHDASSVRRRRKRKPKRSEVAAGAE